MNTPTPRLAIITVLLLVLTATHAFAELWLKLDQYVKICELIVLCTTEIKGGKTLYKVDEVWKGTYSPERFHSPPPQGYISVYVEHGIPEPTQGERIVIFFRKPRADEGDNLHRHSTAFPVAGGKIVYARTSDFDSQTWKLDDFKKEIERLNAIHAGKK